MDFTARGTSLSAETSSDYSLLIEDWPLPPQNPKQDVLMRRLKKARQRLPQFKRKIKLLESLIKSFAGTQARILEVACGTGFSLLDLARHGFSMVGLDTDPHLCSLTNAAAVHFKVKATSVAGDACSLPFGDSHFDLVYSESFFEHVYDVDLALKEQIRVLKNGGILLILDGNLLNLRQLLDLLIFYPIRSKGRYGGLNWIFTKRQVKQNLYGYLPLGRDEDIKTVWWWRRKMRKFAELKIVEVTTSARDSHPGLPFLLHPFFGACKVVAQKI